MTTTLMVIFLCLSCVVLLLLFLTISSKLHTLSNRLDRMAKILEKFKEIEGSAMQPAKEAKPATETARTGKAT